MRVPWDGRSPRELTRAFERFRFAPEGTGLTVMAKPTLSKSEGPSEQLGLFPSKEEVEDGETA